MFFAGKNLRRNYKDSFHERRVYTAITTNSVVSLYGCIIINKHTIPSYLIKESIVLTPLIDVKGINLETKATKKLPQDAEYLDKIIRKLARGSPDSGPYAPTLP